MALLILCGGCRHVAPAAPTGNSEFVFIATPEAEPSKMKIAAGEGPRVPVDVMVRAEAIGPLQKPTYPRVALGQVTGPMMVGVRLTVGADGRVNQVGSSGRALTTPGRYAADFYSAVEDAVKDWRFTPAERRHLVPVAARERQDDYWVVKRAEKTDDVVDVSFTFNASGEVSSGWSR